MAKTFHFMLALAVLWTVASGRAATAPQQERPAGAARPAETAAVDRGRDAFRANCGFCHGIDARGAQAPDLARSLAVLNDDQGKDLGNFLRAGVPERGMPAFPMLTPDEARDLSAFLHTSVEQARRQKPMDPNGILVGDARAGETYFNGTGRCNTCHSPTGDFKGLGAKYDPATLQDRMVNPRGRGAKTPPPPITVKVTLPNGRVSSGRLVAITDFYVTVLDDAGVRRTFPRDNEVPKVDVNDPLQAHLDMLLKYTDADMHNLTAYLVGLK
jgi:mono/diheme cytochrome c family protein/small nuclear ribonucleoprotein (snRNP)-like protein